MQYLKYPVKTMNISQTYNGSYSHKTESTGNPKAYPIDEACNDTGRNHFYAPCDVIIKRIYGVGNKGANTIWLESCEEVSLANGKSSYITIRITHPEDEDLKKYKVGQKFTQGTQMFREGKDGKATGNHFHIEISTCKFNQLTNNGWVQNNKGEWVTAPNSVKPETAFWVDKNFTTIKNSAGLNFKEMPKIQTKTIEELANEVIAGKWGVNPYRKERLTNAGYDYSKVQTRVNEILKGTNIPKVSYYKKYTGKSVSIVDGLRAIGVDSSFLNRSKIAKLNGITTYIGSGSQNKKMLELLKQGKLISKK